MVLADWALFDDARGALWAAEPVFAIVAGVIFLHEPLTAALVTGAVIDIAGVAITQRQSLSWRSRAVAARRLGRQTIG
jgi:drug/metabolite transporter (DMT)-like permease